MEKSFKYASYTTFVTESRTLAINPANQYRDIVA